ncbi:hypothetical protein [Roseateles depolymerans]|uniref:Uncharacterized protein n=1 Tax=Roseateles depolymerans TaxID=76731 RepID=A0A0U3LF67_9BURK|nr:hypothetical protein [Roseateles depolymerans]ALV06703.1 hypothetical protein RD2015_2231 [Roseateles depolymerans]REG19680.1 hypothetical protein DES44_2180 [Roseateles depolymerans]
MGGGGGDGGYREEQQRIERQKQAARDQLNAIFGVAPSASSSTGSSGGMLESVDGEIRLPGSSTTDPTLASKAATNKTARDALYNDIRTNAYNAGKRTFDERKTDAARNNKFALFAQGLAGGSEDVDQNALLERTYNQGLLDLGAKADAAKADFQSNDEQTRLGLLQSIDAGMDQNSALSSALAQLQNNNSKAAAEAAGTTLGDTFADAGLLYTKSNAARGRAAASAYDPFSVYSQGLRKQAGSTGIISNTGV